MFKFKLGEIICCLLRHALKVPRFCEVNFGHRCRHEYRAQTGVAIAYSNHEWLFHKPYVFFI